jgi:hypothetical protein
MLINRFRVRLRHIVVVVALTAIGPAPIALRRRSSELSEIAALHRQRIVRIEQ